MLFKINSTYDTQRVSSLPLRDKKGVVSQVDNLVGSKLTTVSVTVPFHRNLPELGCYFPGVGFNRTVWVGVE